MDPVVGFQSEDGEGRLHSQAGQASVRAMRGPRLVLVVLMGSAAAFAGTELPDALLSNGTRGHDLLGAPRVDAARVLSWTADWVQRGGESLGKPTHFESRAGQF